MTDTAILETCRELITDIRALSRKLRDARDPQERALLSAMLLKKRKQHVSSVQKAASVLDRVRGWDLRVILFTYYIQGRSNRETAQAAGCSVREAQRRKARALEQLKEGE